ncbi:MAG: aspartate aminotransferase family protein [Pseudomonadota bacterium]|jgi:4-aminobutyrate aminotransferase-like enzyme|nr:aspartate aminotransferase family protein [SAR116 cluster bacterium]MEC7721411.1 aspartate aminotransferase family protein [Pseudomonadota bacterium]MEC8414043.1 aspartate aminotransferase family protein [Pseudomonadota bacterium]|tara:strand:- start:14 stop:1357 length:1344 start_codon:yes stop_codon:yes gene_type:complete
MNVSPKRGKMVNGFDPANAGSLSMRSQDFIDRRDRLLGPAYRLFYENPVEFSHASGVFMYDSDGNEYLDAYNNVVSVGHCHPHVNAAIAAQMDTLCTHTRYMQDGILHFAEKLLATFEENIGHLMFTCTGSEANDLALRMAKYHTGHEGIIVTSEAYHGNSELTSGFSPSMGENSRLGTWVRRVPAPDTYRVETGDMGEWLAAQVSDQILDLKRRGQGLAAFVADSLFTSDGIFPNEPGMLEPVIAVVRSAGGVFVADEVQSGFARTGSRMWGYQRHGVIPDIISLGKPMGNGYPVAGIALRPELASRFGYDMRYFNTFGGNTVAMAAANATLEVVQSENLMANANQVGAIMLSGLRDLMQEDERIGDVRGTGLYLGVEMVKDRETREPNGPLALALVNEMRRRRVLISATSYNANVLKVRPPLIFTAANADQFLTELKAALKTVRT